MFIYNSTMWPQWKYKNSVIKSQKKKLRRIAIKITIIYLVFCSFRKIQVTKPFKWMNAYESDPTTNLEKKKIINNKRIYFLLKIFIQFVVKALINKKKINYYSTKFKEILLFISFKKNLFKVLLYLYKISLEEFKILVVYR